jgi:hypothetical protein
MNEIEQLLEIWYRFGFTGDSAQSEDAEASRERGF